MSIIKEVQIEGMVDTANSYDGAVSGYLGIGAVFTGTATDILNCGIVFVNIYTDVASATDGLSIQQSADGTNWDHTDDYTVAAGASKNYSINPHAKYFRVVYTNGTSTQTAFRLQSICKGYAKPSSHRVKDTIVGDDDVELVKAALTGENGDGNWHNVKTTADGNLTISDNSSGLAIAEGNVTGKTFVHKFGTAQDFDTGDGFVTIWDGSEDGEPYEKMQYTYSTSADIDTISSDAADTHELSIQGLDANWDLVTQTKSLNGTAKVTLDTPLIRVFRAYNNGTTTLTGHAFVSVDGTLTAGVPTPANVRAVVHANNNQTEMAVYTIPDGYTGYLRSWYISTAGAKRDSSHTMKLFARLSGKAFRLKHTANIDVNGTSYIQHRYIEPEIMPARTDIEMLANTDKNEAGVSGGFDIVLVED